VTRTEVIVSTNDPDKVTVWMGASGATDLTQEAAEDLAALLMRAVRQLSDRFAPAGRLELMPTPRWSRPPFPS
jgi:hypothetical protein